MTRKKRIYTNEFKEKVIGLSYQSENLKELADELGINVERVRNNKVSFNPENLALYYQSNDKNLQLKFDGDFKIDDKLINTNYSRYDSPFVKTEKKDSTLTFNFKGKSLFLDFCNLKRVY